MSEWLCDDRFDYDALLKEIDAMSEEEKKAYIEKYEKEHENK